MPYSDAELLEEIQRVAEAVDSQGAPTMTAFSEYSDIADSTIYRRFGSWNEAVAAAGFDPNPPETAVAADELIAELQRLRETLGSLPSGPEMDEKGAYSTTPYKNQFGSWRAALVAAFGDVEGTPDAESQQQTDVRPPTQVGRPQQYTDNDLIEELQRIATEHRDPPRTNDIREHSDRSVKTYFRRFGSWEEALEAAGFESTQPHRVSADELIADLHRLYDELGAQPTASDVVEQGSHSIATYQRRFGSWSNALATAFEDVERDES